MTTLPLAGVRVVEIAQKVLQQPPTAATGMIQKVPDLDLELMSLPISFDGTRPPIRRRAPTLGEHNDEIIGNGGVPS